MFTNLPTASCGLTSIRNDEFLSNVAREVSEQVTRLAYHASIVVWGGNNENEVALGWFSQSNNNR